ncbi:twin arginine-targeting protein translocase TatC [Chromatiales bacterium (ex Bugula neritina AB1)]|nr:twin arginine-targeting protein translocase TatC [Chromatiales bacterium (ex Bugula neritina AB1)]
MANGAVDNEGGAEMGLLSHLVELRDRLLRMLLSIGVLFLVLFPFSATIWSFLAEPLTRHAGKMIAIDVASPFLIPFKVCLMLSIFLSAPYLLYQIWAFVAPGLYNHEKRLVSPLLVSSTLLFYLGIAFAYFIVFPLVFGFFNSVAPEGVEVSTDISRYLDFILTIFLAFGIAFEVPVATILLVAIGAATPDGLAKKRPYFVVAAFVVGMFLTPPDIISQTLLALPMWLLFEIGIFFSRVFLKRKEEYAKAAEERYLRDDDPPAGSANTSGSAKPPVDHEAELDLADYESTPSDTGSKTAGDNHLSDEEKDEDKPGP